MDGRSLFTVTGLLDALGGAGSLGRKVGARLDVARSTGPRYAWQRRRELRERPPPDQRRPGYLELWTEGARVAGAELVDRSRGFVEIRRGERCALVWNHWVPLDDVVTLKVALDKPLVHELLTSGGIPVPDHVVFDASDLAPALEFLAAQDAPCVVKPVDREGGAVATSGVRSAEQLRRARLRARRVAQRLMIERQVAGDNYRFLFLDGQLLDVILRLPPRLTGDGRSTVRQLVAEENRRRSARARDGRAWLLTVDLDAVFTLRDASLSLSSVPPAGTRFALKTVVSANAPEDNESVRGDVDERLVAEAARAAELVGVRLAGVDVVTPDRHRPLAEAGGAVLEVNATPGLHYHYDCRGSAGAAVIATIVRRLLDA